MSRYLIFLYLILLASSCGIPTIESQNCLDARAAVREFYSYHFDGEMALSDKELDRLQKYMTTEAYADLKGRSSEDDVFTTNTNNYPKAFRVGSCKVDSSDEAVLSVLLFWHKDDQNIQQEITVEARKVNDKWLFNKVIR
jgi:hypothetical protein